ncbi:MAG: hypothetical protein A2X18_05185 [Bacteroidetes bacterium GWF2_40_14]|nr:MAG: hypothetical protein A2X18_05185 [Bacteroidetes bacterium GWF2_40_14]
MKTTFLSRFAAVALILAAFTACNNANKSFELTGNLEGITEGSIVLVPIENKELPNDTVKIENGKFIFTGNIPEPAIYQLIVVGKEEKGYFYAENSKMTFTGHADSLMKAVISGGETQDYSNEMDKSFSDLTARLKVQELRKELYAAKGTDPATRARKAEINALLDQFTQEYSQLKLDFIKKNPKTYYSAILVNELAFAKNAVEIDSYLNLLDPKLFTYAPIVKLKEKIDQMKQTEVPLNSFSEGSNLAYKVDTTFNGKLHINVNYLSVFSDGNICALKGDGKVIIFDSKGTLIKEFKSNIKSRPSAIAVDKSGNIYVFGTAYEMKAVESRGRTVQVNTPVRVDCFVFNNNGIKNREIKLEGIITATGARISENNLLVADTRSRLIAIYDVETGEKKSAIEKLRTCCGILDFSIRNNNEVLVANLGAFRVESFDYSGKPLITFGQRGSSLDDFHGCCNPVSVAFLSNGGIVTVEKDPTRIKIFSKEGAKKIEGIDELVDGCRYIPMIVDNNDHLYLASKTAGIIKCIPAL